MKLFLLNILVACALILVRINYALAFMMVMFVVPLTLLILNVYLNRIGAVKSWGISCTAMIVGLLTAQAISYIVQSLGKGDFLSPDAETVHLNMVLATYYVAVTFIYFVLGKVYSFLVTNRKRQQ